MVGLDFFLNQPLFTLSTKAMLDKSARRSTIIMAFFIVRTKLLHSNC